MVSTRHRVLGSTDEDSDRDTRVSLGNDATTATTAAAGCSLLLCMRSMHHFGKHQAVSLACSGHAVGSASVAAWTRC